MKKPLPPLSQFSEEYFGFKNNWHHKFFYCILDNQIIFHRKTSRFILNLVFHRDGTITPRNPKWINKNILILTPRFHAKSTVFSFVYPIYEIIKNPNVRILILSANEEISKSFVRQILMTLDNNQKLIQDFGPFAPKYMRKWGEKAIIVKRDTVEKDPTVSAAGYGGRIVSKRADIIIIDDLIDLERARTEGQREKVIQWFENVVYPILSSQGRMIIVGTKWFKGDFYDTIQKEKGFDVNLVLKALIYDSKGCTRKNEAGIPIFRKPFQMKYNPFFQEPLAQDTKDLFAVDVKKFLKLKKALKYGVLWADVWNYDKLLEKRKIMGEASFCRQYLNEPISEEETVIKKKYVDLAMEKGRYYSLPTSWDNLNFPQNFPHKRMIVMMGVDLAISMKKSADFSAIAIWGLDEEEIRWLLHLTKMKAPISEVKNRIVELYALYNPLKCVVESNVFQDIVRQDLAEDIVIVGEKTTSVSKYDMMRGLNHMEVLFEQEKIIIPNMEESQQIAKSFYHDLISFGPQDHTPDTVIASWLALIHLKEYSETLKKSSGYLSHSTLAFQLNHLSNSHRVILTKEGNFFAYGSGIINVFPSFKKISFHEILEAIRGRKIFVIAYQKERALAYFFDCETKEVLIKIDGFCSGGVFASLLAKTAQKFGNPPIAVLDSEHILYELEKLNYPNCYVLFNNCEGKPIYKKGIKSNEIILSNYMEEAKRMIENNLVIKDRQTLLDFNNLLGVIKNEVKTVSDEYPERAMVYSLGLVLTQLNHSKKTTENQKENKRKKYRPIIPYKVFNYD